MKIVRAGRASSGVASGSLPWDKTRRREPPAKDWAPNRLPSVYLRCGCFGIPWPLAGIAREVLCDKHGWQPIAKKPPRRFRRTPSPYGYTIEGQDGLV